MFQWMTRQIADSQNRLLERFIFDSNFVSEMAHHDSHARVADWLNIDRSSCILELGCGPGKYVALLSSVGFHVTGVDPHRFASWDIIERNTNAKLLSDVYAECLPFPDSYFDGAVCLGALLYFKSPEEALKELTRVVKPGGRIVLRTVNRTNLFTLFTGKKLDPASKNLYSMDELKDIVCKVGLSVQSSYSYGFWPPILSNLWWYIVCVWLTQSTQDLLSRLCPPGNRVNNVLFMLNYK
jgi:ubiquinone/menaquinone biosynthesis C-methylase UbiE